MIYKSITHSCENGVEQTILRKIARSNRQCLQQRHRQEIHVLQLSQRRNNQLGCFVN